MVAKSRPRRGPVVQAFTLPPAKWPDWVMSFPEPWISPDPVKQAARMVRFHLWRRDRDAWLLKAGVTWMAVYTEHRRRTIAWQALHPEDRGPTFRTTPKG
jgi:hypothetical protein